jgi:hypothetical protein
VVGTGPARFIFSTEEGKILAWNSSLGTTAQVVADRGVHAIYKGLAIAAGRLYATDFHGGASWGLALGPSDFGRFSGDLLVGNFGAGEINAYAPRSDGTYERVGELKSANNTPIRIDGLWALQFGHGAANNGPINTLFFTAGLDDESHGLFGNITHG